MSLEISQEAVETAQTTQVEQVSNTPPAKGTPEYESWLEAKATERMVANQPVKPEGVPDKFWNAETGEVNHDAILKSYLELEKRSTKASQEKPKVETPATSEKTGLEVTQQENTSGINRAKYSQEIAESGALSDASYKELEAAGWDKGTVDAYIEGQQAKAELTQLRQAATVAEVKGSVGGEQAYEAMQQWGAANLTPAELTMFNNQVSGSGATKDSVMLAVQWLNSKYIAANGQAPKLVMGGAGGAVESQGFNSQAQAIRAMQDPRYKSDPAYRADVERRLANKTY